MELNRKNILITGASRGIGSATLSLLKDRGTNAVGHCTKPHKDLIAADFSQAGSASALWVQILKRFDGKVDAIINNAGVFEPNILNGSDADWLTSWNRTMQINLTASAELCRLAVLHWQKMGTSGRIINIASRAAHRGDSPAHWHYAASKGAMVAMTKTIARAYAADSIYAFAICPGFTMTGMADNYLASRGGDKLLADIPLGRVAMPDEIASIAAYCALDAPASMTGAVLDANGASYVR